jgi:hypothetical protein
MKRKSLSLLHLLLIPVVLACGIVNTVTDSVTGGDSFKPAAELWSDVPRMDGLTPGELEELPLPVKLLMRTILGNLGRLNAEGEDQTTGNVDWISYDHSGAPQDVSSFYTAELMAANGWEAESSAACAAGSATGVAESGVFCSFQKTENGIQKLLTIIATQEDASEPTSVFFLRLEVPESPQ